MFDQISHDDPIWGLTPTELLIAYWSLTLTKPEIADKAHIGEGTVGTHLTSIYTKLGLSELDDEVKRSLLASRHGQSLNSVVKQIDEEFTNYADKTKALQKKKSEALKGRKEAESPSAEPGMQSPPPPPQTQPQTQPENSRGGVPRIVWFTAGFLVLFGVCSLFGLNFVRDLFNQVATFTPQLNTQVVISATETSPAVTQNPTQTLPGSPTPADTSTPEASHTPEETATPEITPTALSLPIREDFSQQYGDLWRVIGEPFITENIEFGNSSYSGVLTVDMAETAILWIGNTAWTDYVVSVRANMPFRDTYLLIGVRVKDINNMVAIECDHNFICSWVVVYQGVKDTLPTGSQIYMEPITITAQGDTFTAVGYYPSLDSVTAKLVLPPKYQGKFSGGGVLLQLTSTLAIDYIQIDPYP
jgi:hypothetical protein